MIAFTKGNILESDAEALVNTVNTVGVMGKGIALMFKEAFPKNFKDNEEACKRKELKVGRMFVTERQQFIGPKWIINFPTKEHWRAPSRMEWIEAGLVDLKRVIAENKIRSIATPPLGSGNGGLDWNDVRPKIEAALGALPDVQVVVYEPTTQYQNVAKRSGVEKLTPARALVAEIIRRYWILGIECSLLEVQKLAYFLSGVLKNCN
jgi:O-acetyl-ADP-ribose deacetylase (regulator of RNase III)